MAAALPQSGGAIGDAIRGGAQTDAHSSDSGHQHLAWLIDRAKGRGPDSYRYLLVMRFAVVNLAAFALLAAAYIHGFVDTVLASDRTNLVVVIFLAFLTGLALCGWKIAQVSRELNGVKEFTPLIPSRAGAYLARIRGRSGDSRAIYAAALRLKLISRIGIVRYVANSLVFLGLIGTVIGFIIALSGVDPALASDASAIAPMVATLIDGMSVALYTTLVGAVLNLWLMINYHMLANGTVNLITSLLELGEAHARD